MTYNELVTKIKASKTACFVFEKGERNANRDRLNIFIDGKILFERFCYGEAAGLVFDMWASGVEQDGTIIWDYSTCQNSKKSEAPSKITFCSADYVRLDDKEVKWNCIKKLKFDRKNKYGFLKVMLKR